MGSDADRSNHDAIQDEIAALKAQLGDLLRRARETAAEAGPIGDAVLERGRAAAETADGYVRNAPLASAAAAFLVGCCIGRLLR